MVGLSKKEIADNLLDFGILISKMRTSPNRKISTLYKEMIFEKQQSGLNVSNYNENSYLIMLRIYYVINALKVFSYYEENFFDSIDNGDLDFSKFKKNVKDGGIFVEGNGSGFSNKQIILFIRNAFNHNDDPAHSKFNISRNGKYIEIHLLDVRKDEQRKVNPNNKKTFHIKISYDDFIQLFNMMNEKIQNYYISFYTSDIGEVTPDKITTEYIESLYLNRVILQKKVPNEVLQEIEKIMSNHSLNKKAKSSRLHDILTSNSVNYRIEQYALDAYQKTALKNVFFSNEQYNSQVLDRLLQLLISDYTPLGMEKADDIANELHLFNLLGNPNITYEEFVSSVNKIIDNKVDSMDDREKTLAKRYNGDVVELIRLNNTFTFHIKKSPFITYISYAIANLYESDSEVIINGIKRNHIRNALTHGWFFIDQKNNMMLYDNFDRRRNDYEFYWYKAVPFVDLLNTVISKSNTEIKAASNIRK